MICGITCAPQTSYARRTGTPVPTTSAQKAAVGNKSSCDKPRLNPGNWHEIFYHERLKKMVLVNGGPEQGKPAHEPLELWELKGKCWALLSADQTGPRWRNFASIAYDSRRGVLVLYGGLQGASVQFEETWEWDGRQWACVDGCGPAAQ